MGFFKNQANFLHTASFLLAKYRFVLIFLIICYVFEKKKTYGKTSVLLIQKDELTASESSLLKYRKGFFWLCFINRFQKMPSSKTEVFLHTFLSQKHSTNW